MNVGTCDEMRDLLPGLVAGSLSRLETEAGARHLEGCRSCREEAALIGLLRQDRPEVPSGLQARVVAASARRRPAWSGWGRHTLAAAVLGAALLGGAALLRRGPPAARQAAPPTAPGATLGRMDGRVLLLPLPGVAEAWPDGGATLDDLSAEELKTLLKELQS